MLSHIGGFWHIMAPKDRFLRKNCLNNARRLTCWFLICKHILDKYAVATGGVGDEDVDHSTDELAILQNRAAAHECVNIGPTNPSDGDKRIS